MYIVFDKATDREITRHGTPEEAARMAAAFNDADGREGILREGGNYDWRPRSRYSLKRHCQS